jgi:hypothetical protein
MNFSKIMELVNGIEVAREVVREARKTIDHDKLKIVSLIVDSGDLNFLRPDMGAIRREFYNAKEKV